MLYTFNPLAKTFRMARDRFKDIGVENIIIQLISSRGSKNSSYNEPSCSEVAAVIVGDLRTKNKGRDIVIEYKKSGAQRIYEDF